MSLPQPYAFEPRIRAADAAKILIHQLNIENDNVVEDIENRLAALNWCTCGLCTMQVTARECICCHEIISIRTRINGIGCVCNDNRFNSICIDSEALEVALLSMAPFRTKKLMLPLPSR